MLFLALSGVRGKCYLLRMRPTSFYLVIATLWMVSGVCAQTLSVRDATTGDLQLVAHVGDTLSLEIVADLGVLPASGIALFLTVPAQGLSWLPGDTRPFRPGALFAGGVEFANGHLASDQSWGIPDETSLLGYAIVTGPGTRAERSRSGTGVVATLKAVCTAPIEAGQISIFDNTAHQTRIVLADGRTELRTLSPSALQLTTTPASAAAARSNTGSWGFIKHQGQH